MKPKIEKRLVAQVKYFEELYLVRDQNGEMIFAGTEKMAKKIKKLLMTESKRKAKK